MGADLIDEEGRFSSELTLVLELDEWSVILSNQSTPVSPGGGVSPRPTGVQARLRTSISFSCINESARALKERQHRGESSVEFRA